MLRLVYRREASPPEEPMTAVRRHFVSALYVIITGVVVFYAAWQSRWTQFPPLAAAVGIMCVATAFLLPFRLHPTLRRLAGREWREQLCMTGQHPGPFLRERLKPILTATAVPAITAVVLGWACAIPMIDGLEELWAMSAITVTGFMFIGFAICSTLKEFSCLCSTGVVSSRGRIILSMLGLALVTVPFFILCFALLVAGILPGVLVALWMYSGMMRRTNTYFAEACHAYYEFGE